MINQDDQEVVEPTIPPPRVPQRRNRSVVKYNTASNFAKRIAMIAKLAGSGQELANRARISRRVIGKYLAGESDPSRERLVAMAEAAGVSVEWLATGRGPMRTNETVEAGAGIPGRRPARRKVDYQALSEALETVQAGVELLRESQSDYNRNLPLSEQSPKDRFKAWMDQAWEAADDRRRVWLEVQIEKSFPEFVAWLKEDKMPPAG